VKDKIVLQLSEEFRYVLNKLESTQDNLFVTGKAGTGKSTLLQLFRNSTRKKVVVLAPTGVAALNVRGQTIHSFFGFPPRLINASEISKRRNTSLFRSMDVLIIDEISMVRADMLDNINRFLKINRSSSKPFGGVQVAFFGDLFQLPPVVANPEEKQFIQQHYRGNPFFFESHVLKEELQLEMVELTKVYRQEQDNFLRLLQAVRTNRIDESDLELLNACYQPDFEGGDFFITLSARNNTVDRINFTELGRLSTPSKYYTATISGNFNPSQYPTEARLELKEGAQVMFLRNNYELGYVNGSLGKIVSMDDATVKVRMQDDQNPGKEGNLIEVLPETWEILKYKYAPDSPDQFEYEVLGTFEQLPLRLAWAITIHKSQGKTFDRAIIDLGSGTFEHGQLYVALSRCRSLDGLVLKQPLRLRDVIVDEQIVSYYETQQR
jgi:ATP-dependent DNA helicase PIF1